LIGNLNQNACAIAHQWIGAHGTPMVEVFQDQQTLLDDRVAFLAFDVGDETDAASVVLVLWIV
jgi:hypothetical protein